MSQKILVTATFEGKTDSITLNHEDTGSISKEDALRQTKELLAERLMGKPYNITKVEYKTEELVDDGKTVETTEHTDGRKDVRVEVNALDVKETDEATTKAKEAIETEVFPRIADADVLAIVVHKPTNQHTQRMVKLPQVRKFAEVAVASFRNQIVDAKAEDFIVVEHHITNNSVKVTTLV